MFDSYITSPFLHVFADLPSMFDGSPTILLRSHGPHQPTSLTGSRLVDPGPVPQFQTPHRWNHWMSWGYSEITVDRNPLH